MVRNQEAQYFTRARLENVRQEDGHLVIEARREDFNGASYTSGSIHTKGKQQFLYGRIEIRANIPSGTGTWPALWMLGVNIDSVSWPMCGEIDILENVGFTPDRVYCTVHTNAYNHLLGTYQQGTYDSPGYHNDYHVHAIEWYEDRIDFYFDDILVFSFANDYQNNVETWPYSAPEYLILNLAIGGSWGGQQGIDDSLFPHQLLIDYVRYYLPN
jgi:beta-glucanase (GH16 family)